MPIPYWAGHYIGLPFREYGRTVAGTDCWGLVRLVLQEQFAAVLPSYAADYPDGGAEDIGKLIGQEAAKWIAVSAGEEQLGDVVVLRMRGAPMHVGLVLGDGRMLHIEKHINSAIEDYRGPRWCKRVSGFYRHPQLTG